MAFKVKDGERFILMGDSITDNGRMGEHYPFGNFGYVRLFTEKIAARHPGLKIDFINKGISGNTVVELQNRWQDDIIDLQPDWLSILVGINDLHRVLRKDPVLIDPAEYRRIYESLLERTMAACNCRVILLDPFYISRDNSGDGFRSRVMELLPEYIEVVHDLHRQYGTLLVPLQEIFQEHLKWRQPDYFCPEPVHPNRAGHTVIAEALYNALTE